MGSWIDGIAGGFWDAVGLGVDAATGPAKFLGDKLGDAAGKVAKIIGLAVGLALQIIIGLILAVLEALVTALQIVGFGGPAGSEMEAKTPGLAELPVVVAELLIDALQPAGGLVVASLQIVVMRIDQVARAAGPLEPIVGVGLYAMLLVVPIGATVLALKTVVPVAGSRLGGMIK